MTSGVAGRRLGLVGGLGVGATLSYYQALVEAHRSADLTPRLFIAHADVGHVLSLVRDGRRDDLARYLGDLLDRLQAARAEIGAIAAVTPHLFLPRSRSHAGCPSSISWTSSRARSVSAACAVSRSSARASSSRARCWTASMST